MARIRIGTVHYLNALPLTADLDPERYELVGATPRDIAAMLAAGEVDVALVPVAAALNDGDYRIVPGWCIGADGPVHSVVIVAETPPEQWTELVLSNESRTSNTLARLLVEQGPLTDRVTNLAIRAADTDTDMVEAARGTTATVVIGDAARVLPDRLTTRLDLAALWKQWTGKPFVFAVWAGRPDLPSAVRDDLRAAGAAGVAARAERFTGDDLEYVTRYIRYPLDESALMGLRWYASMAHRAGILDSEHVGFYLPDAGPAPTPSELEDALDAAVDGTLPDAATLVAWLEHVSDPELAAAAQLRRAALFGEGQVTYLIADRIGADLVLEGGEAFQDAVSAAADADATAVVLEGLDRLDPSSSAARVEAVGAVGLQVAGMAPAGEAAVAHVDAALPNADLAARLLQLRDVDLGGVVVDLALPDGSLIEPGRHTTARWLRVVSVVRLALPEVHVLASPRWLGPEACQAAVVQGADDYGLIGAWHGTLLAPEGTAQFPSPVAEAERMIRQTGLTPVRRDVRFREVGGPLTSPRKVRRLEERA